MTIITQIAGGGRVGRPGVLCPHTLCNYKTALSELPVQTKAVCRDRDGCWGGEGPGNSVSGRAWGCSYQGIVKFVGRSHGQAFLGTQLPLWEAPFVTLMITLREGGSLSRMDLPTEGKSFTRARGTGLEMWQLTRREAHIQDAEVVICQAHHPLTRCVIWPLRALVSSSAKWV